jgi:hypothetical protein
MDDQNDEVLDATVPDPNQPAPDFNSPRSKAYDPDEFRDQARKRITYWLLGLLTLLVTYAFGGLFLIEGKPSFALVSAATGFYFGAQSSKKKDES